MTEETAGQRLTTLRMETTQLTARAAELEDALGSEPTAPPPGVIERLQAHLADILASGTPGERKATIEALVAEIRLTEEGVIPVFRIPGPHTPIPEAPGTSEAGETTSKPGGGSHTGTVGGAGGTRTHGRRIMSPLL
jgi:site-specific DNA recombinase